MAGKLDFVDVLLLQPYKKNAAVETTTVARVQNNALRDMAEPPEIGTQELRLGSPGQTQRVDTEHFSCLFSREVRILLVQRGLEVIGQTRTESRQDFNLGKIDWAYKLELPGVDRRDCLG